MQPTKNSDELQKERVQNNPCGICRAMGFPVCKGHGGGGGGSGNDDAQEVNKLTSQDKTASSHTHLSAPKPQKHTGFDLLEQSSLWHQADVCVFQYNNTDALFSMTIDAENNTLNFQGKTDLTQKEQQALDMFFEAIKHELDGFKKDFPGAQAIMVRTENHMKITIPSPKYFDAFIQRLMDKNLLVLVDQQVLQKQPHAVQKVMTEQPSSTNTAPTPFNFTPKPDK